GVPAEPAEELPRAERDSHGVLLSVRRANVEAALLQPLDVQRPGIHERLDREALDAERELLGRTIPIEEPHAQVLDEARHAEVARLADPQDVVDQLGA